MCIQGEWTTALSKKKKLRSKKEQEADAASLQGTVTEVMAASTVSQVAVEVTVEKAVAQEPPLQQREKKEKLSPKPKQQVRSGNVYLR